MDAPALAPSAMSLEQQLRELQQRYELAMHGANDGLWDWDVESDTLYFSPRWKHTLGYEDHELPNRLEEWEKRIHPDDKDRALATLRSYLDHGGEFFELEHRLLHRDGAYRWFLARGASLRGPDGKVLRMAGSHTDITERKLAEERLRESERRYRAMIDQSPLSIQVFTPEGVTVHVNTAWERMWGATLEQIRGHNLLEDQQLSEAGALPYVRRAFAGEAAAIPPMRYVTQPPVGEASDVGHRWARAFVYPVKDDNGDVREVVLIHEDVTERVEAVELERRLIASLREKEEQYRAIFEATSDAIHIHAVDGTIVEVNPAACAMHEYTCEELINLHPSALIYPEDRHHVAEFVAAMSSGGSFDVRLRNVRKDGTVYPVRVRGASFRYHGAPHMLAVVRDISEEVHAYELLEQRVAERTREILALLDISHNVASTLDLEPLLGLILDGLKMVVDHAGSGIVIREGDELVMIARRGPGANHESSAGRISLGREHAFWPIVGRGESVIIEDVRGDSPLARAYQSQVGDRLNTIYAYFRSWMAVPMVRKDQVTGALLASHPTPGYFTQYHATLATAVAQQAAIAIENARLYGEAQQRTQELTALLDVSSTVASTLELKPLLGLILDGLKIIAEYVGCSVVVLDGDEFAVIDRRGPGSNEAAMTHRPPIDPSHPIWATISRGESVIVDDLQSDAPLARALRALIGEDHLTTTHAYIRAWMAVPLIVKDRAMGMLVVTHTEPGYYTPRHARLAAGVAQHAAIAIENARLYQRAQQLAVIEERQRLARELHDSVTQALFSMTLHARSARIIMERDGIDLDGPLASNVKQLADLTQVALTEMRSLLFELRPGALREAGLVAAVRQHAAAITGRVAIAIDVYCPERSLTLDAETEEQLYRLVQEALHNVVKHAGATNVVVRVEPNEDGTGMLVVEVIDDGVGFDTTLERPGHMGLDTMAERALRVGGDLTIASRPGKGTTVRVVVPNALLTAQSAQR